jgi:thioredoxin reductase
MFCENIIVGAGPAGLQLAYYFKEEGIPYLVLERNAAAASFFTKYPHSRKLISINKKHVGNDHPDFALRHDWNSLIDISGTRFTEKTDDYYPDRETLVEYMNEFAARHQLNIQFNVNVLEITKSNKEYKLYTATTKYTCTKLIIATGMSLPHIPKYQTNVNEPIPHYADYPPGYFQKKENLEKYTNKSLLIFGGGNSSFELANILTPFCSNIIILGKSIKQWAMSSHYVGDIRSVYLPYIDTFLLKSLNAMDRTPISKWIFTKRDDKYEVGYLCDEANCKDTHVNRTVHHIIFCTGWKFDKSIFKFTLDTMMNEKYPRINTKYESINNNNLFFIGSLMHSLDFKKGSGGFIHGFRYLLKYFVSLNYTKRFDMNTLSYDELITHILYKINKTSALYQLYGEMCDIIHITNNITYINNVHYSFINDKYCSFTSGIICKLTLEYGPIITDIPKLGIRTTSIGNENKGVLLHPILRFYRPDLSLIDEIHLDEDLLADFETNTTKYRDRLERIFRMFIPMSSVAPSS